MWIPRARWEGLKAERGQLVADVDAYKREVQRLRQRIRDIDSEAARRVGEAEKRTADMAEKLVAVARKDPIVVAPPDTAAIVKETVLGLATVLNGWRENPASGPIQTPIIEDPLNMVDPENIKLPWEMVDVPTYVPPQTNGNYAPYIPGQGNFSPPHQGGIVE